MEDSRSIVNQLCYLFVLIKIEATRTASDICGGLAKLAMEDEVATKNATYHGITKDSQPTLSRFSVVHSIKTVLHLAHRPHRVGNDAGQIGNRHDVIKSGARKVQRAKLR